MKSVASARRLSGQWSDDDFDVLCDGAVVGRIFKANAAPLEAAGCGHWPSGITKIARRCTATPRRWREELAAGSKQMTTHVFDAPFLRQTEAK
jgi:hypothetical protein